MAVGYNPRAITDGLVLSLDAGSPKNYNAGISTNWTDKIGGNNGTLVNGTYHNDGPFVGAGYVEFDGTGDYLTTATHASDFNFGTGDFTIEFWINSTQTSRADPFAWNFDYTSAGWGSFILNVSSGRIDWYEGLGIATYATSTGWNDGLWHHLAVSRSGTSLKVFLDGVQIGTTASSSYSYGASDVGVSVGFSTSTGYYLNGQMSNVRIVKGTALYTSNFTPPTKPLTAVTNTKLLTCQGNTITDASSSAHSITANGDISLTKEPFAGAGAVQFDGSGDRLSASSSDFSLDGDFTVEYWIQSQNNTGNSGYVLHFGGGNTSYFGTKSGSYVLQANNNGEHFWTGVPTINTWVHLALVRSGSTVTLYEDGISLGNKTESQTFGNSTFVIADWDGQFPVTGYISNFRIIKGTAVYTSNFTPPSRTLEPIENTVLLTCQGQNIKDYSSSAHAITVNGDAKATIVSSSFEFDGTDDYVILNDFDKASYGTTNFSLSLWFNSDSGSYKSLFQIANSLNSHGPWIALISYSSGLRVYVNNDYRMDVPYTQDAWNNFVLTFDSSGSGLWTAYLNGSSVSTYTGPIGTNGGSATYLGHAYNNSYFDGKISNFGVQQKTLTAAEVEQNYNALKGRYA
jgi:hypothetical protein